MVPRNLQAVLWSMSVNKLDLERNKNYIIHQILAYGRWEDIEWLFGVYKKEQIKEVFVKQPAKDYSPAGLKFVSKILLEVDKNLDPNKYDRSTPRIIG